MKQCLRCSVLVLTTDCEEGNKKAMDIISKMQDDESIDPALKYFFFLSDSVHVGKSLKCSFCIWFIILRGEQGCLAVIHTLGMIVIPSSESVYENVLNKTMYRIKTAWPFIRLCGF